VQREEKKRAGGEKQFFSAAAKPDAQTTEKFVSFRDLDYCFSSACPLPLALKSSSVVMSRV
jgi:hypothetical protein